MDSGNDFLEPEGGSGTCWMIGIISSRTENSVLPYPTVVTMTELKRRFFMFNYPSELTFLK